MHREAKKGPITRKILEVKVPTPHSPYKLKCHDRGRSEVPATGRYASHALRFDPDALPGADRFGYEQDKVLIECLKSIKTSPRGREEI
jgi:hypothetical protein